MKKITKIESAGVLLNRNNIDTDQIIPARFLKTTSKEAFGKNLFYAWRYTADGQPNPDFVLNRRKGTILVAGANFGCGSSREHAAWALADYGFQAVIATSFADIFRNNALNNGIVPVQVSADFMAATVAKMAANPDVMISIDIENRTVCVAGAWCTHFAISDYKRDCLMNGYDDIDWLDSHKEDIVKFEKNHE
jgi:3-isopropylmalate/(R)-2-methylmalate dehydratase small subunit